jgi:6-phosphogluconate dehydrogenase
MQLGMIGLGRMGANMVRSLINRGHNGVVFKTLDKTRAIWLMVPAAAVDKTIADLLPHIDAGDILINGGNSITSTTSGAPKSSAPAVSIMSTWVPVGESGVWNGVTAW